MVIRCRIGDGEVVDVFVLGRAGDGRAVTRGGRCRLVVIIDVDQPGLPADILASQSIAKDNWVFGLFGGVDEVAGGQGGRGHRVRIGDPLSQELATREQTRDYSFDCFPPPTKESKAVGL